MTIPKWLPQALYVGGLAVGGVAAWATASEKIRELERAQDSHNSRIGFLESERVEISSLRVKADWAAGKADEAKKLADTLLTDRLNHSHIGD